MHNPKQNDRGRDLRDKRGVRRASSEEQSTECTHTPIYGPTLLGICVSMHEHRLTSRPHKFRLPSLSISRSAHLHSIVFFQACVPSGEISPHPLTKHRKLAANTDLWPDNGAARELYFICEREEEHRPGGISKGEARRRERKVKREKGRRVAAGEKGKGGR